MLGITNFALPKINLPNTLKDFNNKNVLDAGTLFEPDEDLLALFNADLIILDGRTSNLYEGLKKDYPNTDILDLALTTYSYESHKLNIEILGKIFPKHKIYLDEEVDKYSLEFDKIKNIAKDYTALFVQLNGKDISVSTGKEGRFGLLYKEFGFKPPVFDKVTGENNHGTMMADKELIKKVNPDIIFIMDRGSLVDGVVSDEFINDPQLKDIKAVINNDYYYLDVTSWYTISGGIMATNQMIKDINQFINK